MRDKDSFVDTTFLTFSLVTVKDVTNQLNAVCFRSWYNWQIQRDLITAIFLSILIAVNSSFKRNEEREVRARGGMNTFESFASKRESDTTIKQRVKRPQKGIFVLH